MTSDTHTRFWSKVDKTDGCWLWAGAHDRYGYGQVRLASRLQLAHRVAFELTVGPIPDGLELDHLCRVRTCVNPSHLEPVTHKENLHRALRLPWCKNGHDMTDAYVRPDNGRRSCRVCRRERDRLSRSNRREMNA